MSDDQDRASSEEKDDRSYDDLSDDSSEEEDDNKPGVMMSLFSSYYGIKDEPTAEEVQRNPSSYIDTVQFDPKAYVRVSLLCIM